MIFLNGYPLGATNAENLTPSLKPMPLMQTLPITQDMIKTGTYTCPMPVCPAPKSSWWYVLAIVGGVATGVGIAAAALGNR